MKDNSLVKILFRFYSNILDKETTETMWAEVVDSAKGYYKIDNIPFYVPSLASDDIVFAEYDEKELMLTYRNTVEYSGNSTIHIVLMDKKVDINNIRKMFKEMGCESEGLSKGYFAMEVPSDIDYIPIKQKLSEMEKDDVMGYAETCLSQKHSY